MKLKPGERYASSSSEDEAPETEDLDERPPVRVDAGHASGVPRRVRNPIRKIRIGDFIDVREQDGIWYPAQVTAV